MRWELKSIGIWPVIKVGFFLHLILGFISGLLYAPFIMMSLAMGLSPELQALGLGTDSSALGLLLIVMPIMFAVGGAIFGTLFGMIAALAYNLIARIVGGLEFSFATIGEVRPVTPTQTAPPPPPPSYEPTAPPPDRPATPPPPPPPPTYQSQRQEQQPDEPPTDRPISPPPPPPLPSDGNDEPPGDDDPTLPPRPQN